MKFKPGDVVRRNRGDYTRVGVVVDPDGFPNTFFRSGEPMRREAIWAFWCDEGKWDWTAVPAHSNNGPEVTLHPDADKIRARFTAWRLTQ